MARVVALGVPHHMMQRGNRRQQVFFSDAAYQAYPPLLARVDDWRDFLGEGLDAATRQAIRASERAGRPLGGKSFIRKLEKKLDRRLMRGKPGPKPAGTKDQPRML